MSHLASVDGAPICSARQMHFLRAPPGARGYWRHCRSSWRPAHTHSVCCMCSSIAMLLGVIVLFMLLPPCGCRYSAPRSDLSCTFQLSPDICCLQYHLLPYGFYVLAQLHYSGGTFPPLIHKGHILPCVLIRECGDTFSSIPNGKRGPFYAPIHFRLTELLFPIQLPTCTIISDMGSLVPD